MSLTIALAGNPNCGKTTLFNELTGTNQYTGNWPGVTVEKKEGTYKRDKGTRVVDLPGVYSLSPYTPEEVVTRDYLASGEPDVVVNIVDATNLERNLYLTTQILDLGVPVVLALNMMDRVEKDGTAIDIALLSQRLGCPIVGISALRGRGVAELVEQARKAATAGSAPSPVLGDIRAAVEADDDDDPDDALANARYDAIADICGEAVVRSARGLTTTQKIDRVVTNRILGIPIFVVIMTLVYFISVSTVGTFATDWANDGLFGEGWLYTGTEQYDEALGAWEDGLTALEEEGADEAAIAAYEQTEPDPAAFGLWHPGVPVVVGEWLTSVDCAPWLQSLLLDGVIAGVGAVLGFIPQLIVLFLLLGILEGCGYMARVAFIMDRIFRRFGLSGKSFIPMLIASGCGVPAVMATKTIENEKDRRMTVMTATMIPCSAKLPIIALVFGALAGGFYEGTWWVAPLFYFLGLAAIIISCIMLKKLRAFAGEAAPFIMELPPYHLPTAKNVLLSMWERVRAYIVKAGTIIFLSSIVIWFLLSFGMQDGAFGLLDTEADGYLQHSLMAGLGNLLAWVFAPLGFGTWEGAVTTITGLVAKENVVATVGILASLGEASEADPDIWLGFAAMMGGSSAAIMAFCAFNLLCAPCFAAMGAIRSQMRSGKWTAAAIGYLCAFAWVVALLIYQLGGLAAGEVAFSGWTVVAVLLLAAMLFQLFRPMPQVQHETPDDRA